MSAVTFDLPDELAAQMRALADRLPRILELGLRELGASSPSQYGGAAEVLEFLATLPTPEETLALRPSPALQRRASELVEKSRTTGLSPDERDEWQHYEYVDHLVRMAKGRALLKLKGR